MLRLLNNFQWPSSGVRARYTATAPRNAHMWGDSAGVTRGAGTWAAAGAQAHQTRAWARGTQRFIFSAALMRCMDKAPHCTGCRPNCLWPSDGMLHVTWWLTPPHPVFTPRKGLGSDHFWVQVFVLQGGQDGGTRWQADAAADGRKARHPQRAAAPAHPPPRRQQGHRCGGVQGRRRRAEQPCVHTQTSSSAG